MTDQLVQRGAGRVSGPSGSEPRGNDGYVSFELDPLLEDPQHGPPHAERVQRIHRIGPDSGRAGHKNRMIKVPATPAGLEALEEMAAAGVTLNVTLIFTHAAVPRRPATRFGAAPSGGRLSSEFKSVYSIFVSRVDVYTEKHVPQLSPAAQGKVGIVSVKRIWAENEEFWRDKKLPLQQEIIFASTGKKLDWQSEDYYVAALAGSDIVTNPPKTNDAVDKLNKQYVRTVDRMPPQAIVDEIHEKVDVARMEATLMEEGVAKFADPQRALLKLIAEKRAALAVGAAHQP